MSMSWYNKLVDWYNRLVNWNRSYDSSKVGWRWILQSIVAFFIVLSIGWLIVELFPGLRVDAMAKVIYVMLGLSLGFVYERNCGPPYGISLMTLAFLFSWLMSVRARTEEPFHITTALVLWVIWMAVTMLGFILSYLIRCRAGERCNET